MAGLTSVTPDFFPVKLGSRLQFSPKLGWAHDGARYYVPAPGLKEALEIAMAMGQPLLLTGGPGAGKTQAAHWLAKTLNAGKVLRFDVKSTTLGADLLYSFDELGRYRDATARGAARPLIEYIRFNALGEAILRALGGKTLLRPMVGEVELDNAELRRHPDRYNDLFGEAWIEAGGDLTVAELMRFTAEVNPEPESRVVLIDELDKAPRDTPNDLLAEVETMGFNIPELRLRIQVEPPSDQDRIEDRPEDRPVVIITSNAEKPLPEPFTRRCLFLHVPPLEGETLAKVIDNALFGQSPERPSPRSSRGAQVAPIAAEMKDALQALRNAPQPLRRNPGTSEILAWAVSAFRLGATDSLRTWLKDTGNEAVVWQSLRALLKYDDDQKSGFKLLRAWAETQPQKTAA